MANLLTQKQTTEFIRKLKGFSSGRGTKHINLNILEPRAYDILFSHLQSPWTRVLEFERVSDSCEQICLERGLEYQGVYPEPKNRIKIKEWDGDIVVGFVEPKIARRLVEDSLKLLQEGRYLAIYQPYAFIESLNRYRALFEHTPFSKMLVTPGRAFISYDGTFEKNNCTKNGAWFIWEGGKEVKHPEIEWVDELWDKYFVVDEYGKNVKPDRFSRVYKKPIKVRVDRGRPSQAKSNSLELDKKST